MDLGDGEVVLAVLVLEMAGIHHDHLSSQYDVGERPRRGLREYASRRIDILDRI